MRFSGSYDPPLGSVGRQLDRLLLHQLAEVTVRALLRQLVAALLAEPAPHLAVSSHARSIEAQPTTAPSVREDLSLPQNRGDMRYEE